MKENRRREVSKWRRVEVKEGVIRMKEERIGVEWNGKGGEKELWKESEERRDRK